ncbi:MAG: hypothetical protein ACE5HP_11370 [Gemmatimonadota bacterium]
MTSVPQPTSSSVPPARAGHALAVPLLLLTLFGWTSSARPLAAQAAGERIPVARRASNPDGAPNYRLAARFAPSKIRELIHSVSVTPRWIEDTERFWYEWETPDGKRFYLVDPRAESRVEVFDNDRLAAELTRITKDPWDGKHLPIKSIRFIDGNTLRFDVESSQDEERKAEAEEEERKQEREQEQIEERRNGERGREKPKKKVFHFEYTVSTRTLRELEEWEAPDDHPAWASVSPDGKTVVFARHDNLYLMSGEDYAKILDVRRGLTGEKADEIDKAEERVEVEEIQLTTDGEKDYSYATLDFRTRGNRDWTDTRREKEKDRRKPTRLSWSKDSRRFALVREDRRKSGDLWVIHSVGNKRPELET